MFKGGPQKWYVQINMYRLYRKMTIHLFKGDPKIDVSKQKCIDYTEEWPFNVIFLYNVYIFICLKVDTKNFCI